MEDDYVQNLRYELENNRSILASKARYDGFKLTKEYRSLLSRMNELYVTYKQDAYKAASEDKNASGHMLRMNAMEDAIVTMETFLDQESEVAIVRIEEIEAELRQLKEDKVSNKDASLDEAGSMMQ